MAFSSDPDSDSDPYLEKKVGSGLSCKKSDHDPHSKKRLNPDQISYLEDRISV